MEYGKFNSAEELLKGYTELEKSFTQKCQQLSALEKQYNSTKFTGCSPRRKRSPRNQVRRRDGSCRFRCSVRTNSRATDKTIP